MKSWFVQLLLTIMALQSYSAASIRLDPSQGLLIPGPLADLVRSYRSAYGSGLTNFAPAAQMQSFTMPSSSGSSSFQSSSYGSSSSSLNNAPAAAPVYSSAMQTSSFSAPTPTQSVSAQTSSYSAPSQAQTSSWSAQAPAQTSSWSAQAPAQTSSWSAAAETPAQTSSYSASAQAEAPSSSFSAQAQAPVQGSAPSLPSSVSPYSAQAIVPTQTQSAQIPISSYSAPTRTQQLSYSAPLAPASIHNAPVSSYSGPALAPIRLSSFSAPAPVHHTTIHQAPLHQAPLHQGPVHHAPMQTVQHFSAPAPMLMPTAQIQRPQMIAAPGCARNYLFSCQPSLAPVACSAAQQQPFNAAPMPFASFSSFSAPAHAQVHSQVHSQAHSQVLNPAPVHQQIAASALPPQISSY